MKKTFLQKYMIVMFFIAMGITVVSTAAAILTDNEVMLRASTLSIASLMMGFIGGQNL